MSNLIHEKTERQVVRTEPKTDKAEPSLKGAFLCVLLLGGFLALSWVLVFALFIARG